MRSRSASSFLRSPQVQPQPCPSLPPLSSTAVLWAPFALPSATRSETSNTLRILYCAKPQYILPNAKVHQSCTFRRWAGKQRVKMNLILHCNKNKMLHIVGYRGGTVAWERPANIGLELYILAPFSSSSRITISFSLVDADPDL